MGAKSTTLSVAALETSLAGIENQLHALSKKNYRKDGPKFTTLELERSRIAAQLTQAKLAQPEAA